MVHADRARQAGPVEGHPAYKYRNNSSASMVAHGMCATIAHWLSGRRQTDGVQACRRPQRCCAANGCGAHSLGLGSQCVLAVFLPSGCQSGFSAESTSRPACLASRRIAASCLRSASTSLSARLARRAASSARLHGARHDHLSAPHRPLLYPALLFTPAEESYIRC